MASSSSTASPSTSITHSAFRDRVRNIDPGRFAAVTPRPDKEALDLVRERKDKFDRLNADVTAMGGWIISIAGDRWVTVETLPDSAIPETLKAAGHKLLEIEGGERILPMAIVDDVIENPLAPPVRRVHHAGIAKTRRWEFLID